MRDGRAASSMQRNLIMTLLRAGILMLALATIASLSVVPASADWPIHAPPMREAPDKAREAPLGPV